MLQKFQILILLLGTIGGAATKLDCTQISESQIFAGNTVHLPGNYSSLQSIPANFNCIYRITVPVNAKLGLYANVTLYNGLKGVNDQITVIEQTGQKTIIDNRTGYPYTFKYIVIPGAVMTIQVTTKSVFMNSQFLATVSYGNAKIGNTSPLKTGGDMNYFDMNTTRDGKNLFSSVTFTSDEPIFMSSAIRMDWDMYDDCFDCFVIDGTFLNQTQVYKLADVFYDTLLTKSNAITVVSFYDGFVGIVFNTVSEVEQFRYSVFSIATRPGIPLIQGLGTINLFDKDAVEVVNFDSIGIILTDLVIYSSNCEAYIVSGPPNNSSKVLLDLSTNPKLPYSFDLKYFTVINVNCSFMFGVKSYDD